MDRYASTYGRSCGRPSAVAKGIILLEWMPNSTQTIDCQVTMDASASGWGAYMGQLGAAGFWNHRVSRQPSNYQELLAILLAIQSFRKQIHGKKVQILSDNVTSITYVNHLGGSSMVLNRLACAIWAEAYTNDVQLVCRHIAGVKNTLADVLSRLSLQYKWRLHPAMFRILDVIGGHIPSTGLLP